ncbi:MAG: SDR family NAD-dependent epimerase/dehydratase [Candidatus Omnitrophota bacterium]|nr:MAG: SDR family NAD-dependent epimerase/dehydratase [Candidatus Omnitrophota bacterium]
MISLVTGGAGFIGSHLCRRLIERGERVICVDNFISGTRRNIERLLSHPQFKLIEHDISEPLYIEEEIDWMFHLASLASPYYYLHYPIKTLKSGLLGTYNCLGLAKTKGAKFFLASTSEVYGNALVHPQKEEYWGNVNPIGVRSCYDESKRGAEALTYAYMRKHNIEVRVARIFNTYGPNMQVEDGRVVSNFIVQALKGEDITVYGQGRQTRSFCYIDDLIEAILKMCGTDYRLPLNIGNPEEIRIIDLANLILKMTNSRSKVRFLPLPEDDPEHRKPDISKAKSILRWEPKIGLEEGLRRTIKFFRGVLEEQKNL